MRYSWQEQPWQQFRQSVQAGRLAHGLLLTGPAGLGKADFALHAAQSLLCQTLTAAGDPCDVCHACRLVLTGAHPNMYQVNPEKEGHAIKVDQIRELAEFIQQSSLQGVYRIAVINPAHSMNMNAANALLKTLEEPAEGAIIMLVTDQHGFLPATIRSRCQRLIFTKPPTEVALQWLQTLPSEGDLSKEQLLRLAHGAPLLAAQLTEESLSLRKKMLPLLHRLAERRANPLILAAEWQKEDPVVWLDIFGAWVADLVRLQCGAVQSFLHNQDFHAALTATMAHIPLSRNLQILQRIQHMRAAMRAGVNYNKQLLIENLLIRWVEQVS